MMYRGKRILESATHDTYMPPVIIIGYILSFLEILVANGGEGPGGQGRSWWRQPPVNLDIIEHNHLEISEHQEI